MEALCGGVCVFDLLTFALQELVEVDSRQAAQLVLVSFSQPLAHVTRQLSDNEEVLYSFLHGVFEYR